MAVRARQRGHSLQSALEPKGSKWHLHGWACLIGCCVLMMYYTTVSGWMLAYFFRFVKGSIQAGLAADAVSGVYADLLADPFEQIVWMAITVLLGFLVCSRGLQNGIERIGKWMMGALFVLILVLVVHSFVLPGAGEGLASTCCRTGSAPASRGLATSSPPR